MKAFNDDLKAVRKLFYEGVAPIAVKPGESNMAVSGVAPDENGERLEEKLAVLVAMAESADEPLEINLYELTSQEISWDEAIALAEFANAEWERIGFDRRFIVDADVRTLCTSFSYTFGDATFTKSEQELWKGKRDGAEADINSQIRSYIEKGRAVEILEDGSVVRIRRNRSNPRSPPLEERFKKTGILENIRKAKDPALLLKILNESSNFRNLDPAEQEKLIREATKVTLSVVLGKTVVGERLKNGRLKNIYCHMRQGFTKNIHALEPTIWIGDKLLRGLSTEQLARLLLEESQHLVRPFKQLEDGSWKGMHKWEYPEGTDPKIYIEHDAAFMDELGDIASSSDRVDIETPDTAADADEMPDIKPTIFMDMHESKAARPVKTALFVDHHDRSNGSYERGICSVFPGAQVITVYRPDEALRILRERGTDIGLVVTNLHFVEAGEIRGMDKAEQRANSAMILLSEMKTLGIDAPVIIYTNSRPLSVLKWQWRTWRAFGNSIKVSFLMKPDQGDLVYELKKIRNGLAVGAAKPGSSDMAKKKQKIIVQKNSIPAPVSVWKSLFRPFNLMLAAMAVVTIGGILGLALKERARSSGRAKAPARIGDAVAQLEQLWQKDLSLKELQAVDRTFKLISMSTEGGRIHRILGDLYAQKRLMIVKAKTVNMARINAIGRGIDSVDKDLISVDAFTINASFPDRPNAYIVIVDETIFNDPSAVFTALTHELVGHIANEQLFGGSSQSAQGEAMAYSTELSFLKMYAENRDAVVGVARRNKESEEGAQWMYQALDPVKIANEMNVAGRRLEHYRTLASGSAIPVKPGSVLGEYEKFLPLMKTLNKDEAHRLDICIKTINGFVGNEGRKIIAKLCSEQRLLVYRMSKEDFAKMGTAGLKELRATEVFKGPVGGGAITMSLIPYKDNPGRYIMVISDDVLADPAVFFNAVVHEMMGHILNYEKQVAADEVTAHEINLSAIEAALRHREDILSTVRDQKCSSEDIAWMESALETNKLQQLYKTVSGQLLGYKDTYKAQGFVPAIAPIPALLMSQHITGMNTASLLGLSLNAWAWVAVAAVIGLVARGIIIAMVRPRKPAIVPVYQEPDFLDTASAGQKAPLPSTKAPDNVAIEPGAGIKISAKKGDNARNEAITLDEIRAASPKPVSEDARKLAALHGLYQAGLIGKEAKDGTRILLSENLFIKDGDGKDLVEITIALGSLLKAGAVAIMKPEEIRRAALNRDVTKEKMAVVFTKEDFENKDIWNGSDKETSLRASVLIVGDKMTGNNYLYLEGVIGLARAVMARNRQAIREYYRLISGVAIDDQILQLLKDDDQNNIAFAVKAILKFRPISMIVDSEEFNKTRISMENTLIAA
jgi:hypothetical protein